MGKLTEELNREDLAWAAGLFEGEGTFSGRTQKLGGKRDRGLTTKIKMSDEDVLRTFHKIVQVGNITGPYPSDGAGTKALWVWQAGSFEAVQAVAVFLWPWLHSRRRSRIKELFKLHHERGRNVSKS